MRQQIESYIKVLSDRSVVANEYWLSTKGNEHKYFEGQVDLLEDIIAELEGFVKSQNAEDMKKAAEAVGLQNVRIEDKKALLDRLAGKDNYAVDEDGNYDVEASGGPPSPMIPRTQSPSYEEEMRRRLNNGDRKGDYTGGLVELSRIRLLKEHRERNK